MFTLWPTAISDVTITTAHRIPAFLENLQFEWYENAENIKKKIGESFLWLLLLCAALLAACARVIVRH